MRPTSLWRRWRFNLINVLIVLAGAFFLPQFWLAERIIWHRGQSRSLQSSPNKIIKRMKKIDKIWFMIAWIPCALVFAVVIVGGEGPKTAILFWAFCVPLIIYVIVSRSRIQKPEVVGSSMSGAMMKEREADKTVLLEDVSPPTESPPDYSALEKLFEEAPR